MVAIVEPQEIQRFGFQKLLYGCLNDLCCRKGRNFSWDTKPSIQPVLALQDVLSAPNPLLVVNGKVQHAEDFAGFQLLLTRLKPMKHPNMWFDSRILPKWPYSMKCAHSVAFLETWTSWWNHHHEITTKSQYNKNVVCKNHCKKEPLQQNLGWICETWPEAFPRWTWTTFQWSAWRTKRQLGEKIRWHYMHGEPRAVRGFGEVYVEAAHHAGNTVVRWDGSTQAARNQIRQQLEEAQKCRLPNPAARGTFSKYFGSKGCLPLDSVVQ